MLDAEELMFRLQASIGAIRKLRDELVARDVGQVILRHLVDESTLDVRRRERKDALVLVGAVVDITEDLLAGGDDSGLADVVAVMS